MAKFELVLANGKRISTDEPKEVYYFHKSSGTSIRPKRVKRPKVTSAKVT